MEHIQKHLYWDTYGVRTFPYRGKRKYFPCLYQDYDGTVMIRNDVFGLTIAQFERDFKALLERRKKNEANILNIRFPDKTNNGYIEYLRYGDDKMEGYAIAGEFSDEDRQVCKLAQVAGTEYDIRVRQRMFILIENIRYKIHPSCTIISSGSLAEGIDLPGSDVDKMYPNIADIAVIDDIKHLNMSTGKTTFLMEKDTRYPGFCKLKLVAEGCYPGSMVTTSLMKTEHGAYLSTNMFLRNFLTFPAYQTYSMHGPCISDADQLIDNAFCFRSNDWPINAFNWCTRHRTGQWPSYTVVDSILKDGCLLVPIGPKNLENELFWRISFSMAEKRLTHSMNYTQLLCYILLKLTLKHMINRYEEVKDLLCSYFLKTTVFWLSEEISINNFKIPNFSNCYFLCIDKLISFVKKCYCPNYFIPQHNMFCGKIDKCNNKPLLSILARLRITKLSVIMDCIVGSRVSCEGIFTFRGNNDLSVNFELLFYRVFDLTNCKNAVTAYKSLEYIELLMRSESSEFLSGILRYYHAAISQLIPQMLILPVLRRERVTIIRRSHKHLLDGTKTDAVSGWLLYASFYYVLGKYKKSLEIIDNVLSRCTPDMIPLDKDVLTTEDINRYKQKTESHPTLSHKMRQAMIDRVNYIKQSPLIPQELHLEVQDEPLAVPAVVMAQCLQFLCYHHLGDVHKKQRAIRELYLTTKSGYFIAVTRMSHSIVILGVCHEVSGDKHAAYRCYNAALHDKQNVCVSAEQRLQGLK